MAEYPTPPGDSLEPLVQQLRDLQRQLNDMQRPSGTNIAQLVKQVQEALVNINATVISATDNYLATGTVTMNNVNAASVTATGNVRGVDLFSTNAPTPANNFTGGRVAAWLQTADGKLGNTASSRRYKTNIVDSGIDPLAVMGVEVKHYNFIAEVRKRDDPTYEGYVGPDYHVALEVGNIAEDLHAAGLWEFVVYERNDDDTLKLVNGEPVPRSIHYELWSLAVQVAVQHVWAEHQKVRSDVDRILTHLNLK